MLRAFDGKTVEIMNTDAEGRLVLGDVIAWAARTLRPAAMVDVATLTGACMVALGMTTAGLLGPDGQVVDGLAAAARDAGEEVWRLPLTESIKENLKSDRADLKNLGDRMGGAIAAGHFLHAFAGETPWAHLDIAGPSHSPKEYGYVGEGRDRVRRQDARRLRPRLAVIAVAGGGRRGGAMGKTTYLLMLLAGSFGFAGRALADDEARLATLLSAPAPPRSPPRWRRRRRPLGHAHRRAAPLRQRARLQGLDDLLPRDRRGAGNPFVAQFVGVVTCEAAQA